MLPHPALECSRLDVERQFCRRAAIDLADQCLHVRLQCSVVTLAGGEWILATHARLKFIVSTSKSDRADTFRSSRHQHPTDRRCRGRVVDRYCDGPATIFV